MFATPPRDSFVTLWWEAVGAVGLGGRLVRKPPGRRWRDPGAWASDPGQGGSGKLCVLDPAGLPGEVGNSGGKCQPGQEQAQAGWQSSSSAGSPSAPHPARRGERKALAPAGEVSPDSGV